MRGEIRESDKTPEEIILQKKIIGERELFQRKSKLINFPLREKVPEEISQEVLSIIPKESVEHYKMIPLFLDKERAILEVGMVYPENSQAQEALKFLIRQRKIEAKVYLITLTDFKRCLEKYKASRKEMEQALEKLEQEMSRIPKKGGKGIKVEEAGRLVEEAPVIKMVAVILRQSVEGDASDIHIEPTRDSLRVRYRMDGILHSSLVLPLKIHSAIVARIKILSGLRIDETRIPQDGRFSTNVGGQNIDFRVATFPTTLGEKVVLRVLNPETGLKSLSDLGLRDRNLKVTKRTIENPYGMILVTGPTGCGKSTTLYALLRILNKEEVNIVTLEDPVEYFMEGINQSQVKPEIDYTFAKGLRQILRQDPDIIMVGEIRDGETANLAIHAALTGHLVLSTLHTTNVTGVIPRLIDMGIKPFLISPTLSLAVNQRLVRVLCPHCRKKVKAEGEKKKFIKEGLKNLPLKLREKIKEPYYVYEPQGCKKCGDKGYSGRTGIFEIVEMTDNLSRIINKSPVPSEILKEARDQGMTTMGEDGILKALNGVTSLEEIIRVAEEKS